MFVDVNIAAGRVERIAIYTGDSLPMVAMDFARKHGLSAQLQSKLLMLLQSEMEKLHESQTREQTKAAQVTQGEQSVEESQHQLGERTDFRRSLRQSEKRDHSVFDEALSEQLKVHADRIAQDFQPPAVDTYEDEDEDDDDVDESVEEGEEDDDDDDDDDASDSYGSDSEEGGDEDEKYV